MSKLICLLLKLATLCFLLSQGYMVNCLATLSFKAELI